MPLPGLGYLKLGLGALQAVGGAIKAGFNWLREGRLIQAGRDAANVEGLEETHERTKRANRARINAGNEPDPDKLRDEYFRD